MNENNPAQPPEYGIFRDKVMKRHDIGAPAGVAVAMLLLAHGAPADDAVGVVRVDAGTNGVVQAVMPFAPMDDVGPAGYVSGAFLGDGGAGSDRLWRIALHDGSATNAVYALGEWVDPADGLASALTASRGDVLVLASGDGGQFGFWLRGRAAPRAGWPFISGLSVDPEEGFADIAVSTGGCPADMFALDAGEGTPAWI